MSFRLALASVCPEIGSSQVFAVFRGAVASKNQCNKCFASRNLIDERLLGVQFFPMRRPVAKQFIITLLFATLAADYAASRLLCAEAAWL